jgi:excisionase family DNA binding protein
LARSPSRFTPHRTAVEKAIAAAELGDSGRFAPLVELLRTLADQMDQAGGEASTRLAAAYLSALKDWFGWFGWFGAGGPGLEFAGSAAGRGSASFDAPAAAGVNREVVAHLALAMSRHLRECRRDGLAVPSSVEAIAAALHDVYALFPATSRQASPTFDDLGPGPHAPPMDTPLLTKREVGHALRCGVRTVERLLASGALPSVRVGGACRVRREDLESYVAGLSGSFRDRVQRKVAG